MTKVAIIGLGNMGFGMCANLIESGLHTCAYDLNPDAVERAESYGAVATTSVIEAVSQVDYVETLLPAGDQVLDVYFNAWRQNDRCTGFRRGQRREGRQTHLYGWR